MSVPCLAPLDRAALDAAGVPEPWSFGMADRVRFSELDALNHVNNTVFLRWFESFRIPYFAEYGISLYDADSPEVVLKSVACTFHAPMFLGEDYIVTGRTLSYRRTSFRMAYAVFAPDLRAEGEAVIVLLRRDGSGRHPLGEAVKARLAERDGAVAEG